MDNIPLRDGQATVRNLEFKLATLEAKNDKLKTKLQQIEHHQNEIEEMKIKHANDKTSALNQYTEDIKVQIADQVKDLSLSGIISISLHQEDFPNQVEIDDNSNLTEINVKRNSCVECHSKSRFRETFAYCSKKCKQIYL